jgi:hypothetical protein
MQIGKGSDGPAPVHARRYSDVTISYTGLGANEITAVT